MSLIIVHYSERSKSTNRSTESVYATIRLAHPQRAAEINAVRLGNRYGCNSGRSLKVIRNDTQRFATYDFLLPFPQQPGRGLSRTVSEINGDFSQKSQNFRTPVYFAPPLRGSARNLVPARRQRSKLEG